jgi:hypothetical protein
MLVRYLPPPPTSRPLFLLEAEEIVRRGGIFMMSAIWKQ